MRLETLSYTTRTNAVGKTTCILPGEPGYAASRLVQFVSDQRSTCRAYSFILIFLVCVIIIHVWIKQFLDHSFYKNNIIL